MNNLQIFKENNKDYVIYPKIEFALNKLQMELSVDDHKVFDYVIYFAAKEYRRLSDTKLLGCNDYVTITIRPGAYFCFRGRIRPSKREYEKFYNCLDHVFSTSFCWQGISEKRFVCEKINMISRYRKILDKLGKVVAIELDVNVGVISFCCWENKNIRQDLRVSESLRRKYSYKLYLILKASCFEKHTYKEFCIENIKTLLKANELNKYFRYYVKQSIEEINEICEVNWSVNFPQGKVKIINEDYVKEKKTTKIVKSMIPIRRLLENTTNIQDEVDPLH
ncbi:MAG: hypothetical protein Q4D21_06635 [Phascolarctobacterium sp.]|nr:hypothetical protein [Phascolarctobacterium sp.]